MTILAITGGTGFVGAHLLAQAVAGGHAVRALARRPQPVRDGVTWVPGALDDGDALARLVDGADAVIHVAGVVNAPDRAGFARGNVAGTQGIVRAARAAGVPRFVHVSSLAVREPGLSDYGWSKAGAEAALDGTPAAIVRPPAIYGPGDREMLELFRMAARGVVALPPGGRFSVIAAEDLCRLLLLLAGTDATGVMEPDDGTPGGWDHRDFARALGLAVGRRVRPLPVPAAFLRLGARIDRLLRGDGAKLTPDRVGYLLHPDWVSAGNAALAPWRPLVPTPAGLAAAAAWYRAHGLL